jgi:Tol biopolymer transport system component
LTAPTWSPDGTKLALVSDSGIYVINTNDGSLQRIAAIRPAGPPSWSPDGSRIAYATGTSFSGSPELLTIQTLHTSKRLHLSLSKLYGAISGRLVWQPTRL